MEYIKNLFKKKKELPYKAYYWLTIWLSKGDESNPQNIGHYIQKVVYCKPDDLEKRADKIALAIAGQGTKVIKLDIVKL